MATKISRQINQYWGLKKKYFALFLTLMALGISFYCFQFVFKQSTSQKTSEKSNLPIKKSSGKQSEKESSENKQKIEAESATLSILEEKHIPTIQKVERLTISSRVKQYLINLIRKDEEMQEECGDNCYRFKWEVYKSYGDYVYMNHPLYERVIFGPIPNQKAKATSSEVTIDGVRMDILATAFSTCQLFEVNKVPIALIEEIPCEK